MIPFYYEYLAPEYRYIGFVSGNGFGAAVGRLFPVIMAIFILDEETENIWRYVNIKYTTTPPHTHTHTLEANPLNILPFLLKNQSIFQTKLIF